MVIAFLCIAVLQLAVAAISEEKRALACLGLSSWILMIAMQIDYSGMEIEALFPPIFRTHYSAQARSLLWLVCLRRTDARQRRIDYLDGWFAVVDRAVADARGFFRHPSF